MKFDINQMQNIHGLIMLLKEGSSRQEVLGMTTQLNDAIDVVVGVIKESGTGNKLLDLIVELQETIFNKYLDAGFTRQEALTLMTSLKFTIADAIKSNTQTKG